MAGQMFHGTQLVSQNIITVVNTADINVYFLIGKSFIKTVHLRVNKDILFRTSKFWLTGMNYIGNIEEDLNRSLTLRMQGNKQPAGPCLYCFLNTLNKDMFSHP